MSFLNSLAAHIDNRLERIEKRIDVGLKHVEAQVEGILNPNRELNALP
jgi:hypothetical protein